MVPLARVLLLCGIRYKDFEIVSKEAFVSVASSDYGVRGRRTNISRVAVMTGITRKEVKRIRDNMDECNLDHYSELNPASGVLHQWYSDLDFLDAAGRPKAIPYAGTENSFESLVKSQPGDVPAGAVRTELKRVGAIAEDAGGFLKPTSRFYLPTDLDERLILASTQSLHNLSSTLAHNIDSNRKDALRFERSVWSSRIASDAIPRFANLAREHSADLLKMLDDWLAAHESEDEDPSKPTIGVGIFYFVDS